MFPDEPDTQIVEMEQVLKSNVKTSYQHQTPIRFCINQTTDHCWWNKVAIEAGHPKIKKCKFSVCLINKILLKSNEYFVVYY